MPMFSARSSFRQLRHFLAVDLHAAAGVCVKLRDALGEGALAAAGKAHQRKLFSRFQVEVDLLEQLNPAGHAEGQVLGLDAPLKF